MRSIAHLTDALCADFHFRIVALDRDIGDTAPYQQLRDGWNRIGSAEVLYLPERRGLTRLLMHVLRTERYDLLYVNTFFDLRFALLPLVLRRTALARRTPILIAPRGQLASGAMRLNAVKKRAYVAAVRKVGVRGDEWWHATDESEVAEILAHIRPRSHRLRVAANVPQALPPQPPRPRKIAGRLRAVFLSRVSRKKNLDGALRLLDNIEGDVSLDIIGPRDDAGYWSECERLAASRSRSVRVQALGAVLPETVIATIARYDLFVLPTRGENFGHVILEALAAGCPCLISDRTPWRGLAAASAGWDIDLDSPDAWRNALQWATAADQATYARLGLGARKYAEEYMERDKSIEDMRLLLTQALAKG